LYTLVQVLLFVEKWESHCEMLQCAAEDYASTMHEAGGWCRLGQDSGMFDAAVRRKGVIHNAPLDISTVGLAACLASQGVNFVKRLRFKSSDSSTLKDSKSVFLQFTTGDLPGEVKIGYLFFLFFKH